LGDGNWTLKTLIGPIIDLIVKNSNFNSQLGVWLKKLKNKDQIIKDAKL
jgi:hypothetical protein